MNLSVYKQYIIIDLKEMPAEDVRCLMAGSISLDYLSTCWLIDELTRLREEIKPKLSEKSLTLTEEANPLKRSVREAP